MESAARFIDISAPLRADLITWPGVVERFERTLASDLAAGDVMTVSHLRLGAHAGTHVDGPGHFLPHGGGVETLPLEVLIGPAQVVQIAPDRQIVAASDLDAAAVPAETERLLIKTGNSGWSRNDTAFREDYVALDESAAEWCLERGIRLVGIDYLSVEPFDAGNRAYPVHRLFLEAGVVVLESLDLAAASAGPYQLVALPLLIPGSDGAPARAVLIDTG